MGSTMYTIGEFAAFGRVSVRMLRHYDAIGLLQPARVDDRSGYRYYETGQLRDLLRIVELRQLGCGLDDIAVVLGADDERGALLPLLVRRGAELEASVAVDTARIALIGERLRALEGDVDAMSAPIEYRPIDPVTVYAVEGRAPGAGPENVSPVIDPLLGCLTAALRAAGRDLIEPGIFWYEDVEGSEELGVHVSFTADDVPQPGEGYDVVELPAVPLAAVVTHRGDMPSIGESYSLLMTGLIDDGYRMVGPCREVYLVAEPDIPQSDWITELQVPVERD
ncbi:MerR family transcriptional regulator [Microbacterium sp. LWS13-1.2]|uniref:MerR family transcriptional regulator n=1 Tax=Microbacterium sp. LWS13-1.2 TaxID=3135264 RepID=A0AAU6S9H3_9MICO